MICPWQDGWLRHWEMWGDLAPSCWRDSGNPPGGLRPQGCGLGLAGLFHRIRIQLSSVKGGGKGLGDGDLNFLFGHFVWRRAKGDDLVSAVIISGKMAVFPEVGILPDPHLWVARQAAQWREVNQFYTQGVSLLCSVHLASWELHLMPPAAVHSLSLLLILHAYPMVFSFCKILWDHIRIWIY